VRALQIQTAHSFEGAIPVTHHHVHEVLALCFMEKTK
jgi:hypothetical protein